MAKTKVLDGFDSNVDKFLDQNAGVSNIIISNVTNVNVKASVRVSLGPEGTAHLVKDAVIPVGTSLIALNNQLLQTAASKIGVRTDTAGGIEVIYTSL